MVSRQGQKINPTNRDQDGRHAIDAQHLAAGPIGPGGGRRSLAPWVRPPTRLLQDRTGNPLRQRVNEGLTAARASGRQGGRPRVMTAERLRYAQLMADQTRSIPQICRELGGIPSSTLYHYLHADGTLSRDTGF